MTSYPAGTIRALLASDAVTAPTRAALEKRQQIFAHAPPKFFSGAQMITLRAAAARLIPQTDSSETVDVVAEVDERLANGDGNGWRFANLPPDARAYTAGVAGFEQTAFELFGAGFGAIDGAQQDEVLHQVQRGEAAGEIWRSLDGVRFFEELLADLVESYYSHPIAQEQIGYAGMADAPGWKRIGLNELEEREPRPVAEGVVVAGGVDPGWVRPDHALTQPGSAPPATT